MLTVLSGRRARRFISLTLAAVLLVIAVPFIIFATASAHEDEGTDDSAQHAAEDLSGTPISQIEKQTAANAARIFRTTGRRPGLAPQLQPGGRASAQAVSADPGVSGAWSSVIDTPVVPILQAMLPNGKILMWDSVGDNAAET
jgi:hypothetical protein